MKTFHLTYITLSLLFLSTVALAHKPTPRKKHKTLTETTRMENGRSVPIMIFYLDRHSTSQDVINACNWLAKQDVQLTFHELEVGRLFGVIGKHRIRKISGEITLPNGETKKFSAGGWNAFRMLRIQFCLGKSAWGQRVEMIEVID